MRRTSASASTPSFGKGVVVIRTVAHAVDVEGSASLRSEEADIEDTRRRPSAGLSASGGDSAGTGYGAPGRH